MAWAAVGCPAAVPRSGCSSLASRVGSSRAKHSLSAQAAADQRLLVSRGAPRALLGPCIDRGLASAAQAGLPALSVRHGRVEAPPLTGTQGCTCLLSACAALPRPPRGPGLGWRSPSAVGPQCRPPGSLPSARTAPGGTTSVSCKLLGERQTRCHTAGATRPAGLDQVQAILAGS